jgi:hypothetical protein
VVVEIEEGVVDGGTQVQNTHGHDRALIMGWHGLSLLYQNLKDGLDTFQTPRGWPRIACLAIVVQYLTMMMYL